MMKLIFKAIIPDNRAFSVGKIPLPKWICFSALRPILQVQTRTRARQARQLETFPGNQTVKDRSLQRGQRKGERFERQLRSGQARRWQKTEILCRKRDEFQVAEVRL
jgi:hypothetical protein